MRRFALAVALLTVAAEPLWGAAPPSFSESMAEATRRAAEVRDGFVGIAPLELWHKAAKLEAVVRIDADLVGRLESLTPPAARAACHADALDGARRANAAMKDMLRLYHEGTAAPAFDARLVAAARNADNGLTSLESALAVCAR